MRKPPSIRLLAGLGGLLTFLILLFSLIHRGHNMTASWYGDDWHGKLTASGEYFDMYSMTAAHKTLPLGTQLQVLYPVTGKSVVVTITDRGPYIPGRDLDLSYGAARQLGMVSIGVARVKTEQVGHDPRYDKYLRNAAPVTNSFSVQAGAFNDTLAAQKMADQLGTDYRQVKITTQPDSNGTQYCVLLGKFQDRSQAAIVARELRTDGYEAFIREQP